MYLFLLKWRSSFLLTWCSGKLGCVFRLNKSLSDWCPFSTFRKSYLAWLMSIWLNCLPQNMMPTSILPTKKSLHAISRTVGKHGTAVWDLPGRGLIHCITATRSMLVIKLREWPKDGVWAWTPLQSSFPDLLYWALLLMAFETFKSFCLVPMFLDIKKCFTNRQDFN